MRWGIIISQVQGKWERKRHRREKGRKEGAKKGS